MKSFGHDLVPERRRTKIRVVDTTENWVDAITKDIEPKFSLILGRKSIPRGSFG
jgi:hypothetical protein